MTRNTFQGPSEGALRRNGRRLFTVLLALVGLALALIAAPAVQAETVTIGELAPPTQGDGCNKCNLLQSQTAPGSAGYVVPPGQWTLTSWSGQGGVTGGHIGTASKGFPSPGATVGPGSLYASGEFAGDRFNVAATLERPDPPTIPAGPAPLEPAPSLVDTLSLLAEGSGTVASTDGKLHCPASAPTSIRSAAR